MAGGEAGFHEGVEEARTWRSGLNSGKLDRQVQPHQPPTQLLVCPGCGSQRIWKDGVRCTNRGEVQRYICRACGTRFSETTWNNSDEPEHVRRVHTTALYSDPALLFNRQVGVTETQGAKNLAEVEPRTEKRAAGATQKPTEADIKGKIVEYLWHLKKQGYAESTVKVWTQKLKELARKGADLLDPESVKYVMASHNWSNTYKLCLVCAYQHFVKMLGMSWEPPSYTQTKELPFIPLEKEIDALIAGCGKKVAASLQLIKETGMRIGEAWQLRWIDIDEERQTIRCRPEKHGNPRLFKVSGKLIAILNTLPKTSDRVFGGGSLSAHRWNFVLQRRRLALKLQNPRLNKIKFHTFRHWKATMEYHRTKDILYVKQLLGHKAINSTLVYTQLVSFEGDEYHVKVAKTVEEAYKLAEAGFDYFTTIEGVQIFRKRK